MDKAERPSAPPLPTALVICSLQLEFRALRLHLTNCSQEEDETGNIFEVGRFDSEGGSWRVVLAECGPGNIPAFQMVSAGISRFRPGIVFFAGVAGSLKSDISLGHVVASTKVISYQNGKADTSFLPRLEVANSAHALVQRARATARGDRWQSRIRVANALSDAQPGAIVGPIAAGDQVVVSDRSETYTLVKKYCSDALAVEMEGYGTILGATTYGTDAIVIRGISDSVIDKADCDAKGWQPVAAAHAAAFLYEMLANYQVQTTPVFPVLNTEAPSKKTEDVNAEFESHSLQNSASTADGEIDSLKASVDSMSSMLLDWETTLPTGTWIERPELRQLLTTINAKESSTTVVLGLPGAGKSALLAQLGRQLKDEGVQTFAIKADLIDPQANTSADLACFLDLPHDADKCIRILASQGKLVVLIDQLDALGNLLDLHSQRLNVLLNLIRDMSSTPNLHIVCSCRTFEYQHDVRLTNIDAEQVQLELPPWSHIAQLLKSTHDIEASEWPETFRESLRVPQHLKVFLSQLRGSREHHIVSSYQQLLDDLWERKVSDSTGPSGRSELLMDMASQMAKDETLWLPIALFDDRQNLISSLEAADILHRPINRSIIGFRHQTLFEHALARAFVTGEAKLASHVLERQNALFVRPVLWSTLRYLREVSPQQYHRELQDLCSSDLRLHVTYLLIELLGQVDNPTDVEQQILQHWLDDSRYQNRVLFAIAGNEGWFTRLQETHIPLLMELPTKDAWPVVVLLRSAWRFARDKCLKLLRESWLRDRERDALTFNVFCELAEWDESTVQDVCTIVDRTDLDDFRVMNIAQTVSANHPELAPRIIGARLNRELRILRDQPERVPEPLPEGASEHEQVMHELENDPQKDYEQSLRHRDGLYELPAIAEAAPGEYLDEIWPWFVEILGHLLQAPHKIIYSYREYYGLLLDFDTDRMVNNELILSIDTAIKLLAKTRIVEFQEFVKRWENFDAKPIQRLLCRGLVEAADRIPEFALDFLLHDPRRLALGGHQDDHSDTRALIRAVAEHLTSEQIQRLEAVVVDWTGYVTHIENEDAETRFDRTKWNREKRLRLLKTLPCDRLSPETQALILEEETALPEFREYDHKPIRGATVVGSPMSVDQMAKAKDDDILNLFSELIDSTGADHPREFGRGGTVQASQQLAHLTERDPKRVAHLLRKLQAENQQTPAAYAIGALGKNTEYPTVELFALIVDLDRGGFCGDEFRGEAAQACLTRASEEEGLPDHIIELLEYWLESWSDWDYFRDKEDQKEEKEREKQSLLRNRGGFIYPHGSFWLLHALTYGHVRRDPPQYDEWLTTFERHLERPESNYTWKILTEDLRFLHRCDHERATKFLLLLFEKYPKVRDSSFGVRLVVGSRFFLASESYRQILLAIRDGDWKDGKQAFGELLGLSLLFGEFAEWSQAELDEGIADPDVSVGLAYAVAHVMWEDAKTRQQATSLFERLATIAEGESAQALMSTFAVSKALPAHIDSQRLLEAIVENPNLLVHAPHHWFVEKLEDVVTYCPELVYSICNKIIDILAGDLSDIRTSASLSSSNLVNISMTLQRLSDYRDKGLTLFERLLELGVYDASSLLNSLDCRPLNVPPRPRRRRRNRR